MKTTRRDFLRLTSLGLTLPFIPAVPAIHAGESKVEWCFGVIPDTQWKTNMEAPFYGTAIHIIDAINDEMIRHKVDFVLEVGDLVEEAFTEAFQTRAQHNKILHDAGIKFYPLRGNHDSRNSITPVCCGAAVAHYRSAFPNLPGTRGSNGSSPDLPNAAGMTYSFTHKNGKFLLLDTFSLIDDGSEDGKAYKISDYQSWIDTELSQNDHQFALVFAHKDLLGQNHKDNVFSDDKSNQNSFPETQNAFIAGLQKNGVGNFICGHDHMYHRSQIKSPDGNSEVQQIICGSAAHKFYQPEPPFLARETSLIKELNRIGFLIVHVNSKGFRIDYYSTEPFGQEKFSPKWEIRDSFNNSFRCNT
ncbi:MAG: metallophosphoesterase [Planctomycetaceae bacterium]|jgi:hypothetical protein|nr:metallophosphoesterase [Planctomycetaceae bacterium]